MRGHGPVWAIFRAVIAVAALYALVLQGVLGGIALANPSIDPALVLCIGSARADSGPSKQQPFHHHLPCCTVAHAVDVAMPPLPSAVAVLWPIRQVTTVIWRPEVIASPRAPPGVIASARAPPVV